MWVCACAVCAYRCAHFAGNKGCYCLRAGPLGDLCHAFPEKPSCSRSVTIAHGCFLRDRLSWPSGQLPSWSLASCGPHLHLVNTSRRPVSSLRSTLWELLHPHSHLRKGFSSNSSVIVMQFNFRGNNANISNYHLKHLRVFSHWREIKLQSKSSKNFDFLPVWTQHDHF